MNRTNNNLSAVARVLFLLAALILALLMATACKPGRSALRYATVPRDSVVATFATLCDTLHDTVRYVYRTEKHTVEVRRAGAGVQVKVIRDSVRVPYVVTEVVAQKEQPVLWWHWLLIGGAVAVTALLIARR